MNGLSGYQPKERIFLDDENLIEHQGCCGKSGGESWTFNWLRSLDTLPLGLIPDLNKDEGGSSAVVEAWCWIAYSISLN